VSKEATVKRGRGRPCVPPAQQRFARVRAVRLTPADDQRLEALQQQQACSMSVLLRRLVRQALAQEVN
jgi:hypothetical protein